MRLIDKKQLQRFYCNLPYSAKKLNNNNSRVYATDTMCVALVCSLVVAILTNYCRPFCYTLSPFSISLLRFVFSGIFRARFSRI